MSTRRKLMIASWSSPAEGQPVLATSGSRGFLLLLLHCNAGSIHGALDVDMSAALAFIDEQKRVTGEKVTVTTLVVKAVAMVCVRSVFGGLCGAHELDRRCVDARN